MIHGDSVLLTLFWVVATVRVVSVVALSAPVNTCTCIQDVCVCVCVNL